MSEGFDPYRKWLGIAPEEQPPHHYRLLGIPLFESDPDVIDNAAVRQMTHVRAYQSGRHARESQRLLTELSAAKICLLQPDKKRQYDEHLRQQLTDSEPPPPLPAATATARVQAVPAPPPPAQPAPPAQSKLDLPSLPHPRSVRPRRKKSSSLPVLLAIVLVAVLIGVAVVAYHWSTRPTTSRQPHGGGPRPPRLVEPVAPAAAAAATALPAPSPAELRAQRTDEVEQLGRNIRDALNRRDYAGAGQQLRLLREHDLNEGLVNHWEVLRAYTTSIVNRAGDALARNDLPASFAWRERTYDLEARALPQVTYRVMGEQRTHTLQDMPALDVAAFASLQLSEERLYDQFDLVAFLLLDRVGEEPDWPRQRELAEQIFRSAVERFGKSNRFLQEELGIEPASLVSGQAEAPAPANAP